MQQHGQLNVGQISQRLKVDMKLVGKESWRYGCGLT